MPLIHQDDDGVLVYRKKKIEQKNENSPEEKIRIPAVRITFSFCYSYFPDGLAMGRTSRMHNFII